MRRLIVEPPLPFDAAAAWATEEELATVRAFAPARAREYLAWRAIVRRATVRDAAIAYDAAGAPVLTNLPLQITVSHCTGRVAVGISDRRCAVDIERIDRNFGRILGRYLTDEEMQLSDDPLFPALGWCAKETLYKYAGVPGCDLRSDLRIDAIDFAPFPDPTALPEGVPAGAAVGTMWAHCEGRAHRAATEGALTLHFYLEDDYAVVFCFG